MALRGNLRDFSLPDVFQLVTFSKKTGVLRIRRADGVEGSVWFRDGDVFFAQSNWHREPLGERMVKAQRITPNALSRALEVRSSEGKDGRRLGRILIDEGFLSEKVLEAFVQEQIQDTIFDLMRWDEGDFDFEALPELIEEDIGLAVSIENIVMEGARRLEEWTRIKKKVPSMDIVFKMATAPGEGTFEISLKPIEWQLLLLVDGTRSVAELAVETGRTDFEVARIIYGLFSAGLLEIAGDEEVAKLRADRAVREERLAGIMRETELTVHAKAERPAKGKGAKETAAPPAEAAEAEEAEAPSEPAEEPSFLSAGAQAATAEDMAVFEQMMGAVLETPETAAEEPAVEAVPEEPAPEPEPDMGAFMAVPEAPAEVTSAFPAVPAEAEGVEPEAAEAEAPAEPVPPMPEEEPPVAPDTDTASELMDLLAPTAEPETAAVEEPAETAAAPELSGDLERDLMALGLGELAAEEPGPAPAEAPPGETELTIAEIEAVMNARPEEAEVPEGVPPHEAWATAPVLEPVEPMSEMPAEPSAAEEPVDSLELLAGALAEAAESEVETEEEIEESGIPILEDEGPEAEAEPDFTDLLSSLETSEEGEPAGLPELISTDSLEGVEAPTETTGVISTDAFLDEIGGEMDFGTGIGDELTALTGGGGGGRDRQRPTASVKKIPEPGEGGALHMDQTVDKDLVMRIIEGIKEL